MGNNKLKKLKELAPIPIEKQPVKEKESQLLVGKINLIQKKRGEIDKTGIDELIQDYLKGENPNLSKKSVSKTPEELERINRACQEFLGDEEIN